MNPVVFQCRQCGQCCYGRGGVRLNEKEAQNAAAYLQISLDHFTALYLDPGRGGERDIKTAADGFCLFHQSCGLCLIHPAKPRICRQWPFLPGPLKDESAYHDAVACCPGLAQCPGWEKFKRHAK